MSRNNHPRRLATAAPDLERLLTRGGDSPALFTVEQVRCKTVFVTMRDGVRLATDLYLPPTLPAPTVAIRTPYGRAIDRNVGAFIAMARRGYAVVSQDCRGTGDSEADSWDYYIYESEESFDLVEWVSQQDWFDGFLGVLGCILRRPDTMVHGHAPTHVDHRPRGQRTGNRREYRTPSHVLQCVRALRRQR